MVKSTNQQFIQIQAKSSNPFSKIKVPRYEYVEHLILLYLRRVVKSTRGYKRSNLKSLTEHLSELHQ